jgi:hypothetical protein
MSDKLNIANEMRQLDTKNRDFYDSLDAEERKKFSTYLMVRWSSSVQGVPELQEYYVQSCNHYLNKNFFAVSRHPKLQWLMATAVSPGMGAQRHNWISPKKKEAGAGTIKKQLAELYPHLRDDELAVLAAITTQKDINAYMRELGNETKK